MRNIERRKMANGVHTMLEFIVLGIVPGTQTQLTLTWIAGIGSGLLTLTMLVVGIHHAMARRQTTVTDEPIATTTAQLA